MHTEVDRLAGMLREARLFAGLTQTGLAEKAKVSRSSVARFESGNGGEMGLAAVARLFDACGKNFSTEVAPRTGRVVSPADWRSETWPQGDSRIDTVFAAFGRLSKNFQAGALELACQRWLQFAQFADAEGLARFQRLCASNIKLCSAYYLVLERLLHSARRYPGGSAVTRLLTWQAPAAANDRRVFQIPASSRERIKNTILHVASEEGAGKLERLSVEISTCGFVVEARNPVLPPEIELARIARTTDGSSYVPEEALRPHLIEPVSCNAFATFYFPECAIGECSDVDLSPPELLGPSLEDEWFLSNVNFGSFITGPLSFKDGFEPLFDLARQTFLRGDSHLDNVMVYDVNSRFREPELRLYAFCIESEYDMAFVREQNWRYDVILEVYEKKVLRRHLHLARTTTPALAVGVVTKMIELSRPDAEIRYSTKSPAMSRADKS